MSEIYSKIIGVGSFLPPKVLSNADLEKMVDTSDEWIVTRTGMKERRIAEDDVFTSDLGTQAALEAIKDAGITPQDIDLIISATVTPDMYTPSVACLIQKKIGAQNAAAFDVNAACSGFIYAVATADMFIKSGMYKKVLVIGADCLSKVTEYKDRNTCVLFGDGAGAVVLSAINEKTGILATHLGADGAGGGVLTIPGLRCDETDKERRPFDNMNTIWMDGSEVFKFAVRTMAEATHTVLGNIDKTLDDVAMIVPHQANIRIIEGAAKRLKCGQDKIFTNIDKYGNMSAASIPVAFVEAIKTGKIKKGDLFVLVGFGGGLTWGSAAIEF